MRNNDQPARTKSAIIARIYEMRNAQHLTKGVTNGSHWSGEGANSEPNVCLMLGRRRRRRPNIKQTLGGRLVFDGWSFSGDMYPVVSSPIKFEQGVPVVWEKGRPHSSTGSESTFKNRYYFPICVAARSRAWTQTAMHVLVSNSVSGVWGHSYFITSSL